MTASFTVDPASSRQKLLIAAVGLGVLVAGVFGAADATVPLPAIPAFLPAVTTAVMVADLITSFLLIAQFNQVRAPGFAILGAAFLFTGLAAMAQLLAFPGIVAEHGLFGGGVSTAANLWLYWHGGFALFMITFSAVRIITARQGSLGLDLPWLSLEVVILVPIALVMIAILVASQASIPGDDGMRRIILGGSVLREFLRLLNAVALATVLYPSRGKTFADLALAVATLASLIDVLLSVGATPFSVGWYVGRLFSLLSSGSILVVCLLEVTHLYARAISLNVALEKIANLDSLTGLPNRRQFDDRLEAEWRGAIRRRSSLGMLMIDVDFFKRYNDRYGHLAGDGALRAVAEAIGDSAKRTTDMPARYGGEEFAVILPDTELAAATQLAEQIRLAVRARMIPHDESPIDRIVTVSVGIAAVAPAMRLTPEMLTGAADRALYAAKEQGRDRISSDRPVGPHSGPRRVPAGQSETTVSARREARDA